MRKTLLGLKRRAINTFLGALYHILVGDNDNPSVMLVAHQHLYPWSLGHIIP